MQINLLEETKAVLADNGKTMDDIIYICSEDYRIPISDFELLADVNYDNGFGGQEILPDLKLCGANFWLERYEYDGSEWWEYKTMPAIPEKIKILTSLLQYRQYDNENTEENYL